MSPEEWRLLRTVFEEGRTLDEKARAALIQDRLADRPELHTELQNWWASEQEEDPFAPVRGLAREVTRGEREEPPPGDFHNYERLEKIGRGGMGVVYKARYKTLDAAVALKVLPLGNCTPRSIERFTDEQEALARIDHPNVARVYDCGVTPEGQPYYTMAFITGGTITDWCDRRQQNLAQRLILVRQICDGLAQAHGKGIIHRDVNPNNVLVAESETGAQARLIDFGVARFRDSPGRTQTGAVLGTPGYMAPEQLAGEQGAVDVRTDVYGVGALLYHLCAGRPPEPAPLTGSSGSSGSVFRPVLPPQEALDALGGGAENAARSRGMTRAELRERLAGEVGWVISKALEPEPRNRYQDCRALMRDLDNLSAGRPVEAAPTGGFYRIGKLARYHRRALAAAGTVLLLLLLVIALISAALIRTEKAEAEALAALDQVRALKDFNQSVFSEVDPGRAGRLVTGFELLERAEARAEQIYAGQPELEAGVCMALGVSWRGLGLMRRADRQFARAHQLYCGLLGETADETLEALTQKSYTSYMLGNYRDSEAGYRFCNRAYKALYGPDSKQVLTTGSGLALALAELNRRDEAVVLLRQAADGLAAAGAEPARVHAARYNLTRLLIESGRLDEAGELQALQEAEARRTGKPDTPRVLRIRHLRGYLAEKQREWDEAARIYADVLADRDRVLGRFHPDTLLTRNNLAVVQNVRNQPQRALDLLREVLDDPARPEGASALLVLRLRHNLGDTLLRLQQTAEAETVLEDVLARRRNLLGHNNPGTLRTEWTLAEVWQQAGDQAKARARFEDILNRAHESLGEKHPDTLMYERALQ